MPLGPWKSRTLMLGNFHKSESYPPNLQNSLKKGEINNSHILTSFFVKLTLILIVYFLLKCRKKNCDVETDGAAVRMSFH